MRFSAMAALSMTTQSQPQGSDARNSNDRIIHERWCWYNLTIDENNSLPYFSLCLDEPIPPEPISVASTTTTKVEPTIDPHPINTTAISKRQPQQATTISPPHPKNTVVTSTTNNNTLKAPILRNPHQAALATTTDRLKRPLRATTVANHRPLTENSKGERASMKNAEGNPRPPPNFSELKSRSFIEELVDVAPVVEDEKLRTRIPRDAE